MWIELTVACMPAARITASTASICAGASCANSAWSIAMSVMRPALSRANVLPGTSRSTRSATSCRRCVLRARVGSSCAYSIASAPFASRESRNSATAPLSATIASIGQVCAKGSLQPIGRPVIAITGKPAARSRASAAKATGVIAPAVVSVSSMSVSTPTTLRASASAISAQGR